MAEGSNRGPRRYTRASWVALRTLHQRPKVVGENSYGEPIVEIRSVRLVLREGANHFSRVTMCSKCRREVPGAPVLSPADLDHPPHPVICKDCVRNASAPVLSPVRVREPARDVEASADDGPQSDDRVAMLERRVAELAELVRAQQTALERQVDDTRAEVRSFATKELARAQEDIDRMMRGVVERVGRAASGADAGGAQAVEAKLSRSLERLSQRVDDQRAELVADIDARLAQVQATVEDQAGRPTSPVDELRATVEVLARRLEDRGDDGERVEALEARLAQMQDRLDAEAAPVEQVPESQRLESIEAQVQELEARFTARLASAEQVNGGVHEQVAVDRQRLEMLEAQLRELPAAFGAEAARIEAEFTERLNARFEDQAGAERQRMDSLEAHLQELQGVLRAEAGRIADDASSERQRLAALETQLRELRAGVEAEAARITEQADERLARLTAESAPDRRRLETLEARLAAEAARIEAQLDERLDTVVTTNEQLSGRLDRIVEEAVPDRRRLDGLEGQLRALEATIEEAPDAAVRAADDRVQPLEQSLDELVERLDRQAERARRAESVDGRLEALEQRLDDAVERLAGLVESQRLEFQEEVRSGLAEARMAMAADQRGGGRLKKLEDAAAQRDAQLTELMQLQTTLDTGLGELRSEIEELREAAARAPAVESRLQQAVEIPQLPVVEAERGRRGRKSAEVVAGLTAAVQALLNDNRVIRAELATIENQSDTAVRASARASAQAMAVEPLRQDLRALRGEVVAQNQAVAALTKRVESLRKAARPPTTKATKATQATKTTEATKTAKTAKTAKTGKATRTTKKA